MVNGNFGWRAEGVLITNKINKKTKTRTRKTMPFDDGSPNGTLFCFDSIQKENQAENILTTFGNSIVRKYSQCYGALVYSTHVL